MTSEQFQRWQDFALRMARTCFKKKRHPSAQWIAEAVEDFLENIDHNDIPCIQNWDHSDDYPEGSPYYNKSYRTMCWNCVQAPVNQRKSPCPYRCEDGKIYDFADPYPVCDLMSEWEWRRIWESNDPAMPDSIHKRYRRARDCGHDEVADRVRDEWVDRCAGPVRCCVRAGLDCAVAPSAGVLGFTAGDVRRMYPDGVPDWVANGDWCEIPVKKIVAGIGFIPGDPRNPEPFDQLVDTETVWL